MKIGIFSNYEFNYKTMEMKGSGSYRYKLDLGSKSGKNTEMDLYGLMKALKHIGLRRNLRRIDTGVGRDIFESTTKIYGLLGICSSLKLDIFTKEFKDDEKVYYVDVEKIDIDYVKREIEAFNIAFEFFMEKVGFSETEPTLTDKKTFLELLELSKKHITFDIKLGSDGKPNKQMRPNNLLGVAYTELENLFFRNSKIKKCDFYDCGKIYTSSKVDNKCCSSECAMAYRRDKSRFKKAYKEGREKTIRNLTEKYADHVIKEWLKNV